MLDLVIGLRVYPGISKVPVIKGSKLETFTKVYKSILNGIGGVNAKLVIFSDGCDDSFHSMIEDLTPSAIDLEIKKIDCFSNQKSFELQYDFLSKCNSKLVALIEDDYLIESGALESVYDYAKSNDFKGYYTFFNSSDYYDHYLHKYRSEIKFHDGIYWRTAASTTLTFFCSPSTLRRNKVVFRTFYYGNFDHNIWLILTKLGRWKLLTSIIRKPSKNNFIRTYKFILSFFLTLPFTMFKREKLWVCLPGKGIHLETSGLSHDCKKLYI